MSETAQERDERVEVGGTPREREPTEGREKVGALLVRTTVTGPCVLLKTTSSFLSVILGPVVRPPEIVDDRREEAPQRPGGVDGPEDDLGGPRETEEVDRSDKFEGVVRLLDVTQITSQSRSKSLLTGKGLPEDQNKPLLRTIENTGHWSSPNRKKKN